MPITASAKKKMRQDVKRTKVNTRIRVKMRETIKAMRTSPSLEKLSQVYKSVDMASKNHIIHPNKAARLKADLARVLNKQGTKKTPETPTPVKKPRKTPRAISS